MVTFVTKGIQKLPCPNNLRLLKPVDMTNLWKALEEHFMMVPLVLLFNHLFGEKAFS
jgi:hypothetical protein